MEKLKLLKRRIELAGNSISAALFTAAGLLVIKDGAPVYTYVTEAAVLALTGMAAYAVTTWWLYELTPDTTTDISTEKTDENSG